MSWVTVGILESTLEGDDVRSEDGGVARIASVTGEHPRLWVAITSYLEGMEHETDDSKLVHPEISLLEGKRVKVTIEVDDPNVPSLAQQPSQDDLVERMKMLRSTFGDHAVSAVQRLEWMRLGAAWAERLGDATPRNDYLCVCGTMGTMDAVLDHVTAHIGDHGQRHAVDLRFP